MSFILSYSIHSEKSTESLIHAKHRAWSSLWGPEDSECGLREIRFRADSLRCTAETNTTL